MAVFWRRLLSSVVLWGLVIGGLFSGVPWLSDCLVLLILVVLTIAGQAEFYGLMEKRGGYCWKGFGIGCGVVLLAAGFAARSGYWLHPSWAPAVETGVMAVLFIGLCAGLIRAKTLSIGVQGMGWTLLGWVYVPWLANFIQLIYFHPEIEGNFYLLYFVLVTKFSDLGAYVTGSLWGRHKMIPRISPGKTWEGFVGSILISTAASLVFAYAAGAHLSGMTWVHALVLGLVLSQTAVLGDLVESIFKRDAGVKDSGRFFPGIGGILDLIDSLLFNAPLMYLYLRFIVAPYTRFILAPDI